MYDKAILDYTKSLELNPENADTYNNRGNLCKAKGKYEEAEKDYNKTIKLKPRYKEAYHNLGVVKIKLSKFTNAIYYFTLAISIEKKCVATFLNRANPKTKPEYIENLKPENDLAVTYFRRGLAKNKFKNYKGAIEDFDESVKAMPGFAHALMCRDDTFKFLEKQSKERKLPPDPTVEKRENLKGWNPIEATCSFITKTKEEIKIVSEEYLRQRLKGKDPGECGALPFD